MQKLAIQNFELAHRSKVVHADLLTLRINLVLRNRFNLPKIFIFRLKPSLHAGVKGQIFLRHLNAVFLNFIY